MLTKKEKMLKKIYNVKPYKPLPSECELHKSERYYELYEKGLYLLPVRIALSKIINDEGDNGDA